MSRKILIALLGVLLVAALAGAGTFAYFSDTETSTGNTFAAGTLNLQVGANDPCTEQITLTDMEPGDSGAYDWALKNTGSLNGVLTIAFSNVVDNENGYHEPEAQAGDVSATDGELAENLNLTIYIDGNDDDQYNYNSDADTLVYEGAAKNVPEIGISGYPMVAGYDKSIRIEYNIPGTTTSIIQSDKAGFDITFTLEQP